MGQDTVCIPTSNSNECVTDFQFFMISSQKGLDDVDGILGLGPNTGSNGPSLAYAMYQQQQWTEPKASFILGNETEPSYVTFGGDPDASTYIGNFVSQPLVKHYSTWWTMHMNNVKIGGNSVKLNARSFAIADTGTSLLYLLATDYGYFSQMIENASSDFICNNANYPYCYSAQNTCDAYWDKMESLTLFLDHNPYTIQPQGYTISNAWDGWACVVAVSYVSDS